MKTKFARLQNFFHLNFSLSRKQRYEQETTLFSLHTSFRSATKSRVLFHASKFTPIKLIKNVAERIPETSQRRKSPILMT